VKRDILKVSQNQLLESGDWKQRYKMRSYQWRKLFLLNSCVQIFVVILGFSLQPLSIWCIRLYRR